MSESFDPGPKGNGSVAGPSGPPDPDTELRRACAELDGHIPDDYFESFSTKLAATLNTESTEREYMETLEHNSDATGPAGMPMNAEVDPTHDSDDDHDEHSGLHEIKALAGAARKKITRRRDTENDLADSVLSSSSSGLSAVVLPDPEKSTPGIPLLSASMSSPSISSAELATSASTSFGAGITERQGNSKPWLWVAAAGTVLAAAIAVVVVVRGGGTDEVASSQPEVEASIEAPAGAAASGSEAVEGAPAPPQAEPTVVALDPAPDEAALAAAEQEAGEDAAKLGAADGAQPRGGLARNNAEAAAKRERSKDSDNKAKADSKKADKDDGAGKKMLGGEMTAKGGKEGAKAGEKKEEKPNAKPGERGTDINSILDEVTGGPDKATEAVVTEKKADKKRLDSGDVRRAMSKLGGKINNCQKKTGFTGRVRAKFKVAPSGKVTSAKSSGASGKVARCVEAAVRSARFPTFEPPMRSFSYSFLLAD